MFLQCVDREVRDLFITRFKKERRGQNYVQGCPFKYVRSSATEEIMGDKLPREIENPLYRYLIAISKLGWVS